LKLAISSGQRKTFQQDGSNFDKRFPEGKQKQKWQGSKIFRKALRVHQKLVGGFSFQPIFKNMIVKMFHHFPQVQGEKSKNL